MDSTKQKSVSLTQEHKAILGALSGVTHSTKIDCTPQSIKEIISQGMYDIQDQVLKLNDNEIKPEDLKFKFYMLVDDEKQVSSALMNRIPGEIKDRDISVDDETDVLTVEFIQEQFGEDWVIQTGKYAGHEFSYRGVRGAQKIVFSYGVDFVIHHLGFEAKPKEEVEINAKSKGQYLVEGDVLHFIMCETVRTQFLEDGRKRVFFNWYEITINITNKSYNSKFGGKCDRTFNVDLELNLDRELTRDQPELDDISL